MFNKAGQIARHLQTDNSTAFQHLPTAGYLSSSLVDCYCNLDTFSTAGRSIEKSSIFSIASQHLAIYWGLKLDISRSIEVTGIQIFRSDFWARLMYLCRVSFLTTLDLYNAYFRGRHIIEYKENICKRWQMPYSFWKKLLRLCTLGFCNQVLPDLHCWWSEELCNQHLFKLLELVMYWDSCKWLVTN